MVFSLAQKEEFIQTCKANDSLAVAMVEEYGAFKSTLFTKVLRDEVINEFSGVGVFPFTFVVFHLNHCRVKMGKLNSILLL
jgi:hypothetical protein